jgi:hypothetical protein
MRSSTTQSKRFVIFEKETFLARRGDAHIVVLRLEALAQRLRNLPFVLHDEHTHRVQNYIG